MHFSVADLVVVITGASSGIGRATALKLAQQKASVVLVSRQSEALHELAQECEQYGARALAVATDVSDEIAVQSLASRTVQAFGRIDVWINNAGIYMMGRFEDTPSESFRRLFEVNFFGVIHGSRAALAQFRRQDSRGTLINVASVVGKVGEPFASAYSSSKFAITGFDDCLRAELGDSPNIHVCTIFPSSTDTPLFQHAANYAGRAIKAMPPVYPPEDVADAIIKCIKNPKSKVPVGNARSTIAMHNMAPTPLSDRMLRTQVEEGHFQDKPIEPCAGNLFEPMPGYNEVHGGWQEPGQQHKTGRAVGAAAIMAGVGAMTYMALRRRREPNR